MSTYIISNLRITTMRIENLVVFSLFLNWKFNSDTSTVHVFFIFFNLSHLTFQNIYKMYTFLFLKMFNKLDFTLFCNQ